MYINVHVCIHVYIHVHVHHVDTFVLHSTFSAAPGLLFFVTNDVIQYVQLTERTFASFSTVLDDIMVLLDAEAVIIGVCVRVQCTCTCACTFTCTSIWHDIIHSVQCIDVYMYVITTVFAQISAAVFI